jgi:membrane-associated phospholipid phosphatase
MRKAWKSLGSDWDRAVIVRGHPAILTGYALLGALLLATWWPVQGDGRALWDQWDRDAFLATNGSLRSGGAWAAFWAATNTQLFDLVPGLLVLGLYARHMFADGARYWRERLALAAMLLAFIVLWMQFAMKALLDHGRMSPTLVLPDPVLLSTMFDWPLRIKDTSIDCFPGDHVGVMLFVGLVMMHVVGWRQGLLVLLFTIPCSLARVYGGAHWLSDQIVGGGFAGMLGAMVFLTLLKMRQSAHTQIAADRGAVSA